MSLAFDQVRIIDEATVATLIGMDDVIAIIEQAFAADARGAHHVYPVVRERLPQPRNGIFGVKSGLAGEVLGLKAGGFFPANRAAGRMPHQSTIVLFDPDSGRSRAVIGGNLITGLRTGAAGAVAARHLARPDAIHSAIIGCGAQGRMQARALARVRPLASITVWDTLADGAAAFARDLGAELGIPVQVAASIADAVAGADIVVTATPGAAPVLLADWVRPGQHITAIGADTAGKQELDPAILSRARIFVDNRAQAITIGECQFLPDNASIAAELGEVVAGLAPGRATAADITLFDATGVNFQDLVVAHAVLERAEAAGLGVVATL